MIGHMTPTFNHQNPNQQGKTQEVVFKVATFDGQKSDGRPRNLSKCDETFLNLLFERQQEVQQGSGHLSGMPS